MPARCSVVTLGMGDTGQLGLGPTVMATSRAKRVPRLSDVVQVAVGGMHTVCLDVRGKVRYELHVTGQPLIQVKIHHLPCGSLIACILRVYYYNVFITVVQWFVRSFVIAAEVLPIL